MPGKTVLLLPQQHCNLPTRADSSNEVQLRLNWDCTFVCGWVHFRLWSLVGISAIVIVGQNKNLIIAVHASVQWPAHQSLTAAEDVVNTG